MNKNLIIFSILLSSFLLQAQLPPLIPYRKGAKWGAADSTKKIIVPIVYDEIKYLGRDVLCASTNPNTTKRRCTLFNSRGEMIGDFFYAELRKDGFINALKGDEQNHVNVLYDSLGKEVAIYHDKFYEGLAAAGKDGKKGFIDRNNKIVVPFIYDHVEPFINGRAWVVINEDKKRRIGSVDKNGKEIWLENYDVISHFEDNYVKVNSRANGNGVVSKWGEILVPLIPGSIDDLMKGYFSVYYKSGYALWKNGKQLSPYKYDQIRWKSHFLEVKRGELYGLLDTNGKEIVPPENNIVGEPSDDVVLVANSAGFGFYDVNGNKITETPYEFAQDFKMGLSSVKRDGKWALINTKGKLLTGFSYEAISIRADEKDTSVCAKTQTKYCFLNTRGEEIAPLCFETYASLYKGYFTVSSGNLYGVVHKSGKTILPYKFEKITPVLDKKWMVTFEAKRFVADTNGVLTALPESYTYLVQIEKGRIKAGTARGTSVLLNEKYEKIGKEYNAAYQGDKDGNIIMKNDDGLYGLVNLMGEEIIPAIYPSLKRHSYIIPPSITKGKDLLFLTGQKNLITWIDIHGTYYGED